MHAMHGLAADDGAGVLRILASYIVVLYGLDIMITRGDSRSLETIATIVTHKDYRAVAAGRGGGWSGRASRDAWQDLSAE